MHGTNMKILAFVFTAVSMQFRVLTVQTAVSLGLKGPGPKHHRLQDSE